jgi:hypothetical protein
MVARFCRQDQSVSDAKAWIRQRVSATERGAFERERMDILLRELIRSSIMHLVILDPLYSRAKDSSFAKPVMNDCRQKNTNYDSRDSQPADFDKIQRSFSPLVRESGRVQEYAHTSPPHGKEAS